MFAFNDAFRRETVENVAGNAARIELGDGQSGRCAAQQFDSVFLPSAQHGIVSMGGQRGDANSLVWLGGWNCRGEGISDDAVREAIREAGYEAA